MTGIGGCRSSGVLGASAVVSNEGAKLISIHAAISISGGDAVTVKVFNGTSNGGTEIARIHQATNGHYNLEYDMHGVIAHNGLYLDISTGSGTGAAVSVEFA